MFATDLDTDTLEKAAREALTRPSDFGYFGDLPLFESWGFVGGQNAASGTVERSNYRVTLAELQGRATHDDGDRAEDPSEYVQEVPVSDWLVGSADHLAARVLIDPDGPVEAENLTATFIRATELALSLQDYPVLDESDWSELESEEQEAAWDSWLSTVVLDDITEHFGVDDIDELTLAASDTKFDSYNKISDLYSDTNAEAVREAYYRHDSTEWVEEGTSFYNARHENVVRDLIERLFVPRAEQIDSAHSTALVEDTDRTNGPNQLTLDVAE
jgi:hypothetical protein